MAVRTWQKSSYCAQGEACLHVGSAPGQAVGLTESSDPDGVILRTTPPALAAMIRAIKRAEPRG
ncbi:DUF397 domain-containing protein [Streptomyces sp. NBC_00344]|uniref:DUF397 domain-containing protein n=1 Tax=Streptomyces sp. NBC_00344 TaxID=2975720 RepID=UPI002E1C498D